MESLYTIGQVSQLTGISKRTLKYYIECDMIKPSKKKFEGGKGYWLYSNSDISKILQIKLYRELGYSADKIKNIIHSPKFNWKQTINVQIEKLKTEKKHLENKIFVAEFMRYFNECEGNDIKFDISDFDNNIDNFFSNIFFENNNEGEFTDPRLKNLNYDMMNGFNISDIQQLENKIIEIIVKIRYFMDNKPDSKEVQNEISSIFNYFSTLSEFEKNDLNFTELLLGIRLISSLSIDRIFDIIICKKGASDFISKAFQVYYDNLKEEKK